MTLAEDDSGRIAYPIPELAKKLGIHRRTIERKIKAGVLLSSNRLGTRLVLASSVRALFEGSSRD